MLDDGEAEPRAARIPGSRVLHAVEALEDPRQVGIRDAGPAVGDPQDDDGFRILDLGVELYRAPPAGA